MISTSEVKKRQKEIEMFKTFGEIDGKVSSNRILHIFGKENKGLKGFGCGTVLNMSKN